MGVSQLFADGSACLTLLNSAAGSRGGDLYTSPRSLVCKSACPVLTFFLYRDCPVSLKATMD